MFESVKVKMKQLLTIIKRWINHGKINEIFNVVYIVVAAIVLLLTPTMVLLAIALSKVKLVFIRFSKPKESEKDEKGENKE
jgi:hypothetical protein